MAKIAWMLLLEVIPSIEVTFWTTLAMTYARHLDFSFKSLFTGKISFAHYQLGLRDVRGLSSRATVKTSCKQPKQHRKSQNWKIYLKNISWATLWTGFGGVSGGFQRENEKQPKRAKFLKCQGDALGTRAAPLVTRWQVVLHMFFLLFFF